MELESLINKYYENLNENDMYLLQYILEHKEECQNLSITDLSKKCNMSTSSILRMTQKLGFSGYSEFKFTLKNDLASQSELMLSSGEDYIDQLQKTVNSIFKYFHKEDITDILRCLKNARHMYVYGTGWAQKLAGEQLMRTFINCNRPMILIKDYNEFKGMLPNYTKDDFIIIISLSGKIHEIIDSLRILKLKQIPVLSITDLISNELATLATYNLYFQSMKIMKPISGDSVYQDDSMCTLHIFRCVRYIFFDVYVTYFM